MTPHNEAKYGSIAKTVLMPGDPLRAKFVANTYLENVKLVNEVRGMYAYTGTYKGKEVTVMASGMGMPSIGIYSYELYKFYDVDNIIRIGSAGAYSEDINVYDIVLALESYSKSSYAKVQGYEEDVIKSDNYLNEMILKSAEQLNKKIITGKIYSSDVFYTGSTIDDYNKLYNEGCLCTEMESFALFYNAKKLNKRATCLLTISDNLVTKVETTSEERQNSFTDMIEVALLTAINL